MEYRKILDGIERIDKSKGQFIILRNAVEKYNFFIGLYNNEINVVNETKLQKIPCQSLYTFNHSIQNKYLICIVVFIIFPAIFVSLRFIDSNSGRESLYFSLETAYNSLLVIMCATQCYMQSLSKKMYESNYKQVPNPFQNMVYYPDLCIKDNVNNEFLEIIEDELIKLNITDSQKNKILEINRRIPNFDGKLKFMIYDQGLIDYYSGVNRSLRTIKPKILLFYSMLVLLFFLFYPWV